MQSPKAKRHTMSFYRYVTITNPDILREKLWQEWSDLGVLGRIYLSREGINAQVSVPAESLSQFQALVWAEFPDMPFKFALAEEKDSFRKLILKVRQKIVADGLNDHSFDPSAVGKHLDADAFNQAMLHENTVVVDMRNHYECEVGHFQGAYLPKASTFRDALPEVTRFLEPHKDKKILLYCTGGIRCEKASAWLKHQGFEDVNQLHGGIIDYARQVKSKKLPSLFKGVNFVFDDRIGERVTHDVLSHCHQCGKVCDQHTNCVLPSCNLLFIQCETCKTEFENCCSFQCRDIFKLPRSEQIRIQNENERQFSKFVKSRRRPDLKKLKEDYLRSFGEGLRQSGNDA